ncbi:type II toxin-antitoxin system Phd/YefM family antitoxin [Pantoea sp. 22096]|uniref:type II toxin-antitoxin system Phd/YefM family antitoxin n=1 Tax=Pantoea sp. 22096 TaxID=3453873 RepID=UPI003F834E0A
MKSDPIAIVKAGKGYPVAILHQNQPAFYCGPAELYELIPDALDDNELVKLVHERSNPPLLDVVLDQLL